MDVNSFGLPVQQQRMEDIELLPHERAEVYRVWSELSQRYIARPEADLRQFVTEAQNRFAEIGFKAAIDFETGIIEEGPHKGVEVTTPQVTLVERIVRKDFDHDRMSYEVQRGALDGKVGRMTDYGLREPTKTTSLYGVDGTIIKSSGTDQDTKSS